MKPTWRMIAALAVAFAPALRAAAPDADQMMAPATARGGHFVAAAAFDWRKILPAPPAEGSLAGRADLETVLRVQEARTPEQVAWAQFIEHDDLFKNSRVLGAWFTRENLPFTAKFFHAIDEDGGAAVHGIKEIHPRRRPPFADARVHPCVELERTHSYPSGHASQAWMWAVLLGEIFPEKRTELYERARAVMWGRVIGGVHYPTDTVGGEIAGRTIAEKMLTNPAVRAAIARCRAEARPFLLKKAA
ncbi:MAG TPA: phosphatase PAP2 family protein [Opitutus sp.]|nr:phosphatase PAP2 family protein [Opitutus sp.]